MFFDLCIKINKRKLWTQTALEDAVESVNSGQLTCYKAAKQSNIPISTIRRRVAGIVPLKCSSGPLNALTSKQEGNVANYARRCSSAGFPIVLSKLCQVAYQASERSKKKSLFSHTRRSASYKWARYFLKSNNLTQRRTECLNRARAAVNRPLLDEFCDNLSECLVKYNINESQIYNIDETGVVMIQKPIKVVAAIGAPRVFDISVAEK